MKTELHISTTGQQFSFRPVGADKRKRDCLFSGMRYGDGPDAVLVSYGIQGEGYFDNIKEHFDTAFAGIKCVMGYVWPEHVRIYRWKLRRLANVEERWTGYPYGEDGPEMVWVEVTRAPDGRKG